MNLKGWGSLGRPFDSLRSLRVNSFHVREVQTCKLAMIFFGGVVVGLCGVDFVVEAAEKIALAICFNACVPFFVSSVPVCAFVF